MRWDASGYNGILIEDLYRPKADKWPEVNRIGREAIKYYSEQWFPYPYSHATTVEGPIEGMEYPMLTFTPNSPTREDQQWVIAHEFGHEWFPMVVGSNERLYPWMDEGFNTFIDLGNAAKYFAGTPYGDTIEVHPLHLYAEHATAGERAAADREARRGPRPLLGRLPEARAHDADAALRGARQGSVRRRRSATTFARGRSSIPTPSDFFRMMRDESGMELDWFWRDWIFTTARLDQAVDSVAARRDGADERLPLQSRHDGHAGRRWRITFDDGTTQDVKLPIEMWNLGDRFAYRVPGTQDGSARASSIRATRCRISTERTTRGRRK